MNLLSDGQGGRLLGTPAKTNENLMDKNTHTMKTNRLLLCILLLLCCQAPLQAQNTLPGWMEKLDRGLVALPASSGGGIFVSWRFLGTDEPGTRFEILRDGQSLAQDLYATNYTDASGKKTHTYQIVTHASGTPADTTAAVKPWSASYLKIILNRPSQGENGGTYDPNDCSVGDVDGDGEYEIFVKWNPSNAKDNSQDGITDNVFIDCYKLDGTMLWRVDLGRNIRAGAHYTQFMVYDFDGDEKAEMMCKTAPGSIDGKGKYVNEAATDDAIKEVSGASLYRSSNGKITGGQEWLTVFQGETGEALHTIFYNPNRNTTYGGAADGSFNWDDRSGHSDKASYGNRGERFLAAVAHVDGADKPACGIFCRGYYTYAFVWAVGFDGKHLYQKWFNSSKSKTSYQLTTYDKNGKGTTRTLSGKSPTSGGGSGTMYGNGNHNMSVADVDGDGCDEIIWGAAALDHDGTLLYATGFGHGDALHMSDLNPERPGLEIFQVHEEKGTYAWDVHDAATGEILLKGGPSGVDNGRGIAAQLDPKHYGFFFSSAKDSNQRSAVSGDVMSTGTTSMNFRIYWDGDLQDELLDGNKIDKWQDGGTTRLVSFNSLGPSSTCNSTKNTPCLSADILGDWREEVILYQTTNSQTCLAIYSTNIPSTFRVPTLMHDHTYRMGVCWQNTAYNQPPHLGYYLAEDNMPSIIDLPKRLTAFVNEPVEWSFATRNASSIEQSYYYQNGEKKDGLPEGIECEIGNAAFTLRGTFREEGSFRIVVTLTGKDGDKVPFEINIVCRSGEEGEGRAVQWDFTHWSETTVANLLADAAASKISGWSDVESQATADADGDPTDLSKNNCFWAAATILPDENGELSAAGELIGELRGLRFQQPALNRRNLAIAVNYPSTSLGDYHGPSYLWLGGAQKDYFVIPDVKGNTEITMGIESHKSSEARGVQLFINEGIGSISHGAQLIDKNGNNVAVPTKYAEQTWFVPETSDIVVYNTNGCHIYFIKAVQVAGEDQPDIVKATTAPESEERIYNLLGQRTSIMRAGIYIVNGKKLLVK